MKHPTLFLRAGSLITFMVTACAYGADCPDRFESTRLDYVGRSTDNTKSYWLTSSNRTDHFRLSAPGVPDIDQWTTSGASLHLSVSSVVDNSINGTHKLDRLNPDNSFDCFLSSRNQNNPLIPPTWRPPQKPVPPIAIRPEQPDRPVVVRPVSPTIPVVVRPENPDRPVVERPQNPDLALVTITNISHEEILQRCPAAQRDSAGHYLANSLAGCTLEAGNVPLTAGRDLLSESAWNTWTDIHYQHTNNDRDDRDREEEGFGVSQGLDRKISERMIVGGMLTLSKHDRGVYHKQVNTENKSFTMGPYISYLLTSNWSLFGSTTVGYNQGEHELLGFSGDYETLQYAVNINAQGQYRLGESHSYLRPTIGISYGYENSDKYSVDGSLLGDDIAIIVDKPSGDFGQIVAGLEWNSYLHASSEHLIVIYLEPGVIHNYLLENDLVEPRWAGTVRAGLRSLVSSTTQVDIGMSYDSLGVDDLDDWSAKLFVSHAF